MKSALIDPSAAFERKTTDTMKAFLRWAKVNSIILINAGSLVGTTGVTSVLGFVYWWLAARQFSPNAVGFASAAISTMTLLGTFGMLGLGTLLLGELPQQRGKEASFISTALIVVGIVGGGLGIAFAVIAVHLSTDFRILGTSIENIVIFAVGVSLTAITLVLDQAFIGLLKGGLQLWRNTLFAGAKLVALFVVSIWLTNLGRLTIYETWLSGNVFSLVVLAGFLLVKKGVPGRNYLPQWKLLRKLGLAALKHHVLNITLNAPSLILPLLVTILLSATTNALFYVSWNLGSLANIITSALTTTLYAASSSQPATKANKIRLTLSLALAVCVLTNCVLLFGSKQVLGLFGHSYAEQAAWSLRILSLESFPYIIKSHYIAVSRINGRVAHATQTTVMTGIFELGGATAGAVLGGLTGLSLGWLAAMCVEAIFMSRTVYRSTRFMEIPVQVHPEHISGEQTIWLMDTVVLNAITPQIRVRAGIEPGKYLQSNRGITKTNPTRLRLRPPHLEPITHVMNDEPLKGQNNKS